MSPRNADGAFVIEDSAQGCYLGLPTDVVQLLEVRPDLQARVVQLVRGVQISAAPVIQSPRDAYVQVYPLLAGHVQERLVCVALNRRQRVLAVETVTVGTDAFTIVDPRQVLRWLLHHGASGLILAHNHPSGDAQPSQADVDVTRRIEAACRAVGLRLHDHLVVTDTTFTSLADLGHITASLNTNPQVLS